MLDQRKGRAGSPSRVTGGNLKPMISIVMTGDLLRVDSHGLGTQCRNLSWFENLFSWQVAQVADKCSLSTLYPNDKARFSTEVFYNFFDIQPVETGWFEIYAAEPIPTKALDYIAGTFRDNLVIGYELPDIFLRAFDQLGIFYVDFTIHPVRYLDDIFFAVRSNNTKVRDALKTFAADEYTFWVYAGIRKATMAQMEPLELEPNSCLFVGQTEVDRSLIRQGELLTCANYASEIVDIGRRHKKIYVKPHPYAKDKQAISEYLDNACDVELIDENIYRLLADRNIDEVVTLSSSVAMEARYFGKKSTAFYREGLDLFEMGPEQQDSFRFFPIIGDYWDIGFWQALLSPFIPLTAQYQGSIAPVANRLRTSLGYYWGHNFLENEILMRTIFNDQKFVKTLNLRQLAPSQPSKIEALLRRLGLK